MWPFQFDVQQDRICCFNCFRAFRVEIELTNLIGTYFFMLFLLRWIFCHSHDECRCDAGWRLRTNSVDEIDHDGSEIAYYLIHFKWNLSTSLTSLPDKLITDIYRNSISVIIVNGCWIMPCQIPNEFSYTWKLY